MKITKIKRKEGLRHNLGQARRQDSVTGGAEMNFGRHEKFICVNSRGAQGHEKFISVWIKWTRWRSKIQREFPAKIANSSGFSGREQVIFKKKKKRVFIPKMSWNPVSVHKKHENNSGKHQFGLRFALSSLEPINFFGAQSSLGRAQFSFGGAQAVIWGETAPICPPWRRIWFRRFQISRSHVRVSSKMNEMIGSLRPRARFDGEKKQTFGAKRDFLRLKLTEKCSKFLVKHLMAQIFSYVIVYMLICKIILNYFF